ncbi:protein phosphatase 2C domain-containing protein [Catenuloplanes japonicus]|uniref:protein phosphatase 2C domain-containing protein n=1 Tax=Catenuloplanes japonicus TaxID=33876 RepID=UPI000A114BA0|nr:protein phosphatase 2C domain-containing protein [Catenuloplanes japonicus]
MTQSSRPETTGPVPPPAELRPLPPKPVPAPVAESRPVITVRASVAPPPAARAEPLGEPLVLVGSPRLRSVPRAFPSAPGAPPDTVIDGGEIGGLTVRAASLRGDDHRHLCEPRQDSFALHRFPLTGRTGEPVLLACVADGVGSQPLSHLGSAAACRFLGEEIGRYADRLLDPAGEGDLNALCRELVTVVAARMEREAAVHEAAPKALSTTLVAGLFGPAQANGGRRVVLFAVGDSPAYLLRDGDFEPTFRAAGTDEMAGAPTFALPRVGDVEVMIYECVRPGGMILLCTDGLGNPMHAAPVRSQLAQWWRTGPPGLPAFFWQLSFRAQSFGDDRTAVCVWVD